MASGAEHPEPATGDVGDGEATGGRPSEAIGEEAIRAALAEHGEDVAAAIERTDQVKDLVDLAILTVASADEDQVEHVTAAASHLVRAVDGLSTEGSVALAEAVGDNGEELTQALETIGRLQREGKLDELFAIAGAVSAVDVDDGTVAGLDRFASAVSAAESRSRPVGVLGFLGGLWSQDARVGLGYLLELLRALGRGRRRE